MQAVFEIHMERNMEQAMKPSMINAGLVPTKFNIAKAILGGKMVLVEEDDGGVVL